MNEERLLQVLLSPHVSEKSTRLADAARQHVFKVAADATKPEVRRAVEQLFEVKVQAVRIVNTRGKAKRVGQRMGRRSDWKKAYVTLEPGYDIDLTGMES
ncbi:MAG TPA: 50S ribosomal protein L23 [Chromatiales bacterium]|nr:50S ribosomal protein L23 [Chromatiales bacterium]